MKQGIAKPVGRERFKPHDPFNSRDVRGVKRGRQLDQLLYGMARSTGSKTWLANKFIEQLLLSR